MVGVVGQLSRGTFGRAQFRPHRIEQVSRASHPFHNGRKLFIQFAAMRIFSMGDRSIALNSGHVAKEKQIGNTLRIKAPLLSREDKGDVRSTESSFGDRLRCLERSGRPMHSIGDTQAPQGMTKFNGGLRNRGSDFGVHVLPSGLDLSKA